MMINEETKQLCLDLISADTEDEVIRLLRSAGMWDEPASWRNYGDYENNYNTIGNQQSSPDAALVEKVVNAIDARLMNECLIRGINPEGPTAPQSIQEAVAHFFDQGIDSVRAGRIREWPISKRTEVARNITVVATGAKAVSGRPCFTISDSGEGQTPATMPSTFLSLTRSNKLRIPFVQGKFNMGGTGVLNFCGYHNLQLIVTRRNPRLLASPLAHPSDTQWGFTIVRRENAEGGRKNSVYTYMAPLGADLAPHCGEVLRFSADTLPMFPEGNRPYVRESTCGTLVKLYEYSATGFKSNMLMRDGVLGRADILLPEVALPVRFHECRSYAGHAGSFETTLTGLSVRLDDDKKDNLEFSSSSSMTAAGHQMTATIYAFKKGKADTYRKNEGIIFTLNGQTHGYLSRDFFTRKSVGLSYLADSILVVVDCSKFSVRAREDLFMNSRDRLTRGELRAEIERALEDLLKNHDGLRALKEQRRREELESRLQDSKPLKETLEALLKRSPTLAALFLQGNRIATPFKTIKTTTEEQPFVGKSYPTYFRFRGKDYGFELHRDCPINMRCRIAFETDAVDDYFSRDIDRGEFTLYRVTDSRRISADNYVMNLQNGIATLSVQLPDNCCEGDQLDFVVVVTDSTQIEPFDNKFSITVAKATVPHGGPAQPREPTTLGKGEERVMPAGIALPNIIEVAEKDWQKENPPFDRYAALRITDAGHPVDNGDNGNGQDVYDFYVNVDNVYLKSELKSTRQEPEIVRRRFIYGLVLFGLALLHDEAVSRKRGKTTGVGDDSEREGGEQIEAKVESFSRAIAPFLLPIMESLGSLDLETPTATDDAGEAA